MTKNHKVASSSVANKTKNKSPIKQGGNTKPKFTKKQISIICGVIAVLVAALVVVLVLVLGRNQTQENVINDAETTQDEPNVDYDQKITDKDGGEFKAEYQAGSEQSFAMRFSDLKCEDNCKNVSEVKLGDKTLKQGEDYEVKSGSIIIILTENFMKSLKADKYDLVIAVIDADKTLLYGVKFTVKPEEQPSQNQTGNTTTKPNNNKPATKPTQPSQQPSVQQTACERRAGPTAFLEISYLTPEQKQAWIDDRGASPDIVALVMQGNFQGTTKMVWRNGRCQPSFGNAIPVGDINQPFNMVNLPAKAQANPNRNAVIWLWADDSEEIEFVNDPYTFIYNHD